MLKEKWWKSFPVMKVDHGNSSLLNCRPNLIWWSLFPQFTIIIICTNFHLHILWYVLLSALTCYHWCCRMASQLQILQHVGFTGWSYTVLCSDVCHQLVGCSSDECHCSGTFYLRQLQEARWVAMYCIHIFIETLQTKNSVSMNFGWIYGCIYTDQA